MDVCQSIEIPNNFSKFTTTYIKLGKSGSLSSIRKSKLVQEKKSQYFPQLIESKFQSMMSQKRTIKVNLISTIADIQTLLKNKENEPHKSKTIINKTIQLFIDFYSETVGFREIVANLIKEIYCHTDELQMNPFHILEGLLKTENKKDKSIEKIKSKKEKPEKDFKIGFMFKDKESKEFDDQFAYNMKDLFSKTKKMPLEEKVNTITKLENFDKQNSIEQRNNNSIFGQKLSIMKKKSIRAGQFHENFLKNPYQNFNAKPTNLIDFFSFFTNEIEQKDSQFVSYKELNQKYSEVFCIMQDKINKLNRTNTIYRRQLKRIIENMNHKSEKISNFENEMKQKDDCIKNLKNEKFIAVKNSMEKYFEICRFKVIQKDILEDSKNAFNSLEKELKNSNMLNQTILDKILLIDKLKTDRDILDSKMTNLDAAYLKTKDFLSQTLEAMSNFVRDFKIITPSMFEIICYPKERESRSALKNRRTIEEIFIPSNFKNDQSKESSKKTGKSNLLEPGKSALLKVNIPPRSKAFSKILLEKIDESDPNVNESPNFLLSQKMNEVNFKNSSIVFDKNLLRNDQNPKENDFLFDKLKENVINFLNRVMFNISKNLT